MATINTTNPTLLDVANRFGPDGKVERNIAEVYSQMQEGLFTDMTFKEGNLPTGELVTIRTGYPEATWRRINEGVSQVKTQTQQVTETCGWLENRSEIDERLADLNGNREDWRFTEDLGIMAGMTNQLATAVFYSNTKSDPEKIHGFAPRFGTYSSTAGSAGNQIIKAGGSGSDNTSIWLIGWGPLGAYGIYPKGSKAGISAEDKGKEKLFDSNSKAYYGYVTQYKWDVGLVVKDWGYVVRIANIDVSDLTKNAATGADLIDLMIQASEQLKGANGVRPVFYCNRTVRGFLRRQLVNKSNVLLSMEEVAGKKVLVFDDIPVRRVDAILNTEAAVS